MSELDRLIFTPVVYFGGAFITAAAIATVAVFDARGRWRAYQHELRQWRAERYHYIREPEAPFGPLALCGAVFVIGCASAFWPALWAGALSIAAIAAVGQFGMWVLTLGVESASTEQSASEPPPPEANQ